MRPNKWNALVRGIVKGSYPGAFTDADIEEYRKAWSQPGAMTAMVNWYRAAVKIRPKMPPNRRISAPTMIVWGARDRFIIREAAQMSLEYCDDARLEYIEDATHWLHHEKPQRVNQLILDFLTE